MEIIIPNSQLDVAIDTMIDIAKRATCKRSKCGSVIINKDYEIIGTGFNSMPCNQIGECFKSDLSPTFKSDKTCCIHAEQRAIMDALKNNSDQIVGSTLLFIRLDENDMPKNSGRPYCSICSKMALDARIANFVLKHEGGWTAYDTVEYNELTFQFS